MTRLFVAAWPPPDVAERLGGLCRTDEPGVRPVSVENLHITLRFLGDLTDAEIIDVVDRLHSFALPRVSAAVGTDVVRLDDRQIVLPVAGIDELAHAVRGATESIGPPTTRPFYGHLTLARMRSGAHSSIEGLTFDAEFPITEVRLVESRLDPSGAEYRSLESLGTTGAAAEPVVNSRLSRGGRRTRSLRR